MHSSSEVLIYTSKCPQDMPYICLVQLGRYKQQVLKILAIIQILITSMFSPNLYSLGPLNAIEPLRAPSQ